MNSMHVLQKLFLNGVKKEFKKNSLIMAPNKKPNGVYQITKGFIFTYNLSLSGKRRIQVILKPGDIFPIVWAMQNIEKKIYIEALTNATTLFIPRKIFFDAVTNTQDASLELIDLLLVYLNSYVDRVDNLEFTTIQKKLIHRLLFIASRFGTKDKGGVYIDLPLTHQLIADSINVSRENVTRDFKFFEKQKLLSFENHKLVIHNLKKLQEMGQ